MRFFVMIATVVLLMAACAVPTPTPTPIPIAQSGIAFQSNRNEGYDIFVMAPDGTRQTQLTDGGSDFHPTWSPDGGLIAFASDRDGNGDIYVMNADVTDVTRLTHDPAADWSPDWSRAPWDAPTGETVDQE